MTGISILAVFYHQVYKEAREYYHERGKASLPDKQRFHRFCAMNERVCIPYF